MALIGGALATLPAVINDLQAGTNSRHGYKAWFKSNDSSAYIQGLLQDIYTGQPRIGLQPQPDLLTGPRISCVTPATVDLYPWMRFDPFWACVTHSPAAGAYYYSRSSYILICPYFWSMQPYPLRSFCPTVIHNRFVGNRGSLSAYQTHILIHEMVHFYLGLNSLTLETTPPEQYELNDCVALDTVNSLRNPSNYQNYLASKSCYPRDGDSTHLTTSSGPTVMYEIPRPQSVTFPISRRKFHCLKYFIK